MTLYIYGYCLLQPLHEYGSISWHSELLQALVYIVRSTLSFIIFNITHKVVQCNLKSLLNYRQSIAYINTPWTVKRCHFVFDYNSGISWSIFLYFLHQWKQVGILYKHVDKIYHFTLNVSPHYLVKLKPCINSTFSVNHHSAFIRTSCSQFSQKVLKCSYFPFSVGSCYISLLAEKLAHSRFFCQKIRIIFNSTYLIFRTNCMK